VRAVCFEILSGVGAPESFQSLYQRSPARADVFAVVLALLSNRRAVERWSSLQLMALQGWG